MRHPGGIPEDVLIAQYAGKFLNEFSVFNSKLGINPTLRWRLNDLVKISIYYSPFQEIVITCKHRYEVKAGVAAGGNFWGVTHQHRIKLHDPDGIDKAENILSAWSENHCTVHQDQFNLGRSFECCANHKL